MCKQRIHFFFKKILCFFYAFFICLSAQGALPCPGEDITAEILQKTAFSKEWLTLVHYRPTLFGGYKSSIDSVNFFVHKKGKTNPLLELKATIQLFQETNKTEQKCLFPARYMFLKEQGLIHAKFPVCEEYQSFQKDLNPNGVTFLYTDAYMSNPASLFGHTLMRIDIPEGKTQLVAHGMNYGAYVDEKTAGALYAIYGITGGYYGGFTVKPYYNVINMYNNMENRDIWEYTLNLTPSELEKYVAHLWEVGHTQTRYYFFTKNCSYLLMEVLDAIRPDLNLAEEFNYQTIPLDTVKAVNRKDGFVQKIVFRPSRQKRIAYRYNQMNQAQKKALLQILKKNNFDLLNTLDEPSQAKVLEAAYEYVQYQWVKQEIDLKDYRRLSFQILKERRNMTPSAEIEVPQEQVLNAHHSKRLQISGGMRNSKAFTQLALRPAYHSLTDSPAGLLPSAEINFLDTALRYYTAQKKLKLQEVSLVKISSFAPFNALFHPVSFQIDTYVAREYNPKTKKDKLMYTLKGGSGLTTLLTPRLSLYGLVNSLFRYGGNNLAHRQGIGAGPSIGLLYQSNKWRLQSQGDYTLSDNNMLREISFKQTLDISLTRQLSFGTSYRLKKRLNRSENELIFFLNKFF